MVAAAALPPFNKLLLTAEKQSLKGIGVFERQARTAARLAAREQAEVWAIDLMALAEAERKNSQEQIDLHWAKLHGNDPDTVVAALSARFTAAARPVRVHGVADGEAGLLTTVAGPDSVPDAKPAVTPSGAATLHKVNKTERAAMYQQLVASYVLLAAKEAMAIAPGLIAVRVIAVDGTGTPLVAARLRRDALNAADWRAGAWHVLHCIDPDARSDARGRTGELRTIDLRADAVFGTVIAMSARPFPAERPHAR